MVTTPIQSWIYRSTRVTSCSRISNASCNFFPMSDTFLTRVKNTDFRLLYYSYHSTVNGIRCLPADMVLNNRKHLYVVVFAHAGAPNGMHVCDGLFET